MSVDHIYNLCCKYKGRMVDIRTKDGKVHRGIIQHVDNRKVYIQPEGQRGFGGFGWGFWAPGFGIGIALGTIFGIAVARPYWW